MKRNLPSVYENPDIIENYLKDEINYMCVAGHFDTKPFSETHINRVGIIPKSTPSKWKLIIDLSFLLGYSVNDGISEDLKDTTCPSVQQAIKIIKRHGKGCLMAKFDLKRA